MVWAGYVNLSILSCSMGWVTHRWHRRGTDASLSLHNHQLLGATNHPFPSLQLLRIFQQFFEVFNVFLILCFTLSPGGFHFRDEFLGDAKDLELVN